MPSTITGGETNRSGNPRRRFMLFDGGPSGLVTIRLVREIEKNTPGFVEQTDVFAGASDGGFISLYLARALDQGMGGLEAVQGCIAFLDEMITGFRVGPRNLLRLASGLTLYGDERMRAVLSAHFGDCRLGQLRRQAWLTAYNVSDGTSVLITPGTHPGLSLVDAACASAACPLLFPLQRSPRPAGADQGELVADGGFIDNSSILTTLTHGLSGEAALSGMTMLSLGSRQNLGQGNPSRLADAGTGQEKGWPWWLSKSLHHLLARLDGGAAKESNLARGLLGGRYHRHEPALCHVKLILMCMLAPERLIAQIDGLARSHWASSSEIGALLEWIHEAWMPERIAAVEGEVRPEARNRRAVARLALDVRGRAPDRQPHSGRARGALEPRPGSRRQRHRRGRGAGARVSRSFTVRTRGTVC